MGTPEQQVSSPVSCPATYQANVEKWEGEPLGLLKQNRVPWSVIANLAKLQWATLADLSNIYLAEPDLINEGPKDLDYEEGTHGITRSIERRITVGLLESMRAARMLRAARTSAAHGQPAPHDPSTIMGPGQRESMEVAYERITGRKPDLEDQGSDSFLTAMFKETAKGNVGNFQIKDITSKIPTVDGLTRSVRRRTQDEFNRTVEHEALERAHWPTNMDAWRHMLTVFKTTLLMCIYANGHQAKLQCKESDIDDFNKFLNGPQLATRQPPPPLQVLIVAERKAWNHISIWLHKGKTLSEAISTIMADALFWSNEVIRLTNQRGGQGGGKGSWANRNEYDTDQPRNRGSRGGRFKPSAVQKGKGRWNNNQQRNQGAQIPYNYNQGGAQPAKAKGKGKNTKGKNKSKNKKGKAAQQWVSKTIQGQLYCWDYHSHKCKFGNQCRNSHNCPVDRGDGHGCNKPHLAENH